VADLRMALPSVVAVLAPADVCDRLAPPGDVSLLRVAPGEALLVGPVDMAAVGAVVGGSGLVVDVSDGWVALVLEGADAPEAFARISELELPERGWIQGEVARAASKVLVEPGRIVVLVPAMLASHVDERIRIDAAEVVAS
jgi:sarcosine oxidase gamma subunit